MMSEVSLDEALAGRLARLTDEDPVCCAMDLTERARALRDRASFGDVLARAKALSDPNRLIALGLLLERGEMCACEIQAALGVTHATVSHHMTRLEDAGLVNGERRGAWTYYGPSEDAGALLEVWST